MGVVFPGANSLTVPLSQVGHVEVAVGVERQGLRTIQPGEGGGGRGAPRCELAHRAIALVGHVEVAAGVERQGLGTIQPAERGVGVVLPGANSLTVLLSKLAT